MLRRPSRIFLSGLAGVSITATGLLSHLRWPLWPAGWVLDLLRIADPFGETTGMARAAILGLLIAVNSAAWAIVVCVVLAIASRRSATPASTGDQ